MMLKPWLTGGERIHFAPAKIFFIVFGLFKWADLNLLPFPAEPEQRQVRILTENFFTDL